MTTPIAINGVNRQLPSGSNGQQNAAGLPASAAPSGNGLPDNPAIQESQAASQTASSPPAAEIQESVARLSDFVQSVQRNLSFSVDDITGDTVILVTDRDTDEVIRQIPSEELLNLARNLNELQQRIEGDSLDDLGKGNLFDQSV